MAWLGYALIISMKITIVYRYFWPDVAAYSFMVKPMSEWFAQAGHEVNIITAQPAYKPTANIGTRPWRETVNNVNIRRLLLFLSLIHI